MIFTREIGEKGQVVIPRDVRQLLGLKSRSKIVFEVENKEVKIKPEREPEEFLKDFLKYRKKGRSLSFKELKKIEDESYDIP